jgi:hypothetical protein
MVVRRVGDTLRVGDVFPRLAGEALSGKAIAIPDTAARRRSLVVFSFSSEAGKDARLWNERLSRDLDARDSTDIVSVLELESVPRLMRGFVVLGIKRGVPPSVRDQMMVLVSDEALWKDRLAVTTTTRSYAVLLDASGRIRWMSDGSYSDDGFAQLRRVLRRE